MTAHQAPLSMGFSRQEHWSGLPCSSPMQESEKWKWSRSVVSNSSRSYGLQPTRLLCSWDFPGKSTRVGCHCLLCHHWVKPKINALCLLQNNSITWMSLSIQSLRLTSSINPSRKPFLIRLVPVLDNYPLLTPSTPLHLLALPITRACLPYYFVLSPTPLTLRGAVPHHLFRRRS